MSILKNAIDSIALGLEDYESSSDDERRIVSCTRNIYAGILLLFKHKLSSLSDSNTDEVLLKERVRPKLIDNKILWVGKGSKTVDYQSIKDRFDSLGITVDWKRIDKINDYRNNVEHYFSSLEHEAVQGLISNSFIIIRDFITEQLHKDPKELLGDESWSILINVHEVYEKEKENCVSSIESLSYFSDTIKEALVSYSCQFCGSDLVCPTQLALEAQECEFLCRSCNAEFNYKKIIRNALENHFEFDAYFAMSIGEGNPITDCPYCGGTYIFHEKICAEHDHTTYECQFCGSEILQEELNEYNLCEYCTYKMQQGD